MESFSKVVTWRERMKPFTELLKWEETRKLFKMSENINFYIQNSCVVENFEIELMLIQKLVLMTDYHLLTSFNISLCKKNRSLFKNILKYCKIRNKNQSNWFHLIRFRNLQFHFSILKLFTLKSLFKTWHSIAHFQLSCHYNNYAIV